MILIGMIPNSKVLLQLVELDQGEESKFLTDQLSSFELFGGYPQVKFLMNNPD